MSDPMAHGAVEGESSTNLETPTVALAIGAHPDDVEFGCGGTLAKWASKGCVIHHVVCTDGSKGTWDPDVDKKWLARRREDEQREAWRRLGGSGEVVFLGRVDGELVADLGLRAEAAMWIRRLRPDVILAHDPWKRYRLHPDHRQAGFVATDSIVAARDPLFFPEQGLQPHRPGSLLLWEADAPDHAEDIADFEAVKLSALLAHRSQFRSTMKVDRTKIAGDTSDSHRLDGHLQAFAKRVEERHRSAAEPFGLERAEIFKLITNI
jgi:LmbE family N-acetylglucosaminyl deacetylase